MVGFDRALMSSSPRQLTSWKEIAHYLDVNIRTAQKWERDRGLPVRRVFGARSRVSTDAATLEAWKLQVAGVSKMEDRCYRWPIGPKLTVEVRFIGSELDPAQIDLLREYLTLLKTALCKNTG